jgi:preflagellin peptidase FlaK
MFPFDAARVGLTLLFLTYASWSDYKSREVSDKVWAILAPLSLVLALTELLLYDQSQLTAYGICFGLTSVFAIVLFYVGGFGGADAKALICLALALPFYPESLFTAVVLFVYNLLWRTKTGNPLFEGDLKKESMGKKITVMITGYKTPFTKLKEKWHIYPMEDVEETPEKGFKRKLVILPKDEGRDKIMQRLDAAINAGNIKDRVWATPGLPMLIFVTAGLIVALFFGDIVWIGIRLILR